MKQLLLTIFLGFTAAAHAQQHAQQHEVPVDETDLRIVRRTAEILKKETSWNRQDNGRCLEKAKAFSLYCALFKSTTEIKGEFDSSFAAVGEMRRVVAEVSKVEDRQNRLVEFNNNPATGFQDIAAVLKLTEARIKDRLGSTNYLNMRDPVGVRKKIPTH